MILKSLKKTEEFKNGRSTEQRRYTPEAIES